MLTDNGKLDSNSILDKVLILNFFVLVDFLEIDIEENGSGIQFFYCSLSF